MTPVPAAAVKNTKNAVVNNKTENTAQPQVERQGEGGLSIGHVGQV